MRIGVSCRGLFQQYGGVRTYISTLLPSLVTLGSEHEFVFFYDHPRGKGLFPQVAEIVIPSRNGSLDRVMWDHIRLPQLVRKHNIDVILFPKGGMPFGLLCKAVPTILDLGYFKRELRAYPLADTIYQRWFLKSSARRADHILAISEATKKDIIYYTNVLEQKITVCYLAVPHGFSKTEDKRILEETRRRHRLPSQIILYPGSISPRKNVARMIEAFARIQNGIPHALVMTGTAAWGGISVEKLAQEYGVSDRIIITGPLTREDLAALYSMATCSLYVSLCEGFGLPIIEAMACGCPVITSSVSSMPEAAGDAAELVDPTNVEEIAEAIIRVVTNASHRTALVDRGYENIRRFTPERLARLTLSVLVSEASRANS